MALFIISTRWLFFNKGSKTKRKKAVGKQWQEFIGNLSINLDENIFLSA